MAAQAARKDYADAPTAPARPAPAGAKPTLDPLIAALARAVDRAGSDPAPRHRPESAG